MPLIFNKGKQNGTTHTPGFRKTGLGGMFSVHLLCPCSRYCCCYGFCSYSCFVRQITVCRRRQNSQNDVSICCIMSTYSPKGVFTLADTAPVQH